MKYALLLCIAVCCACMTHAQHTLNLLIKNANGKSPLAGASVTIQPINKYQVADSTGLAVFRNLAPGNYTLTITYTGMQEKVLMQIIPHTEVIEVLLSEEESEESEVVVTTTRISRTISDIPTRIETISGEELQEKGNMKPGDIRMLLNESTGIQTQQTSATSNNSGIRIQGLDGRYTQLLRDGLPLYAGFSGGLSLMQVAPLDLKQVEVIKGSSSTLYGGGAIAGLVNLVSKTPGEKREFSWLLNGISAKGADISTFYSQRFDRMGITVFGSVNTGSAYDPAGNGLTAIPRFTRYTINPRLFLYGQKNHATIGVSYITENRLGGSMDYIQKEVPGYYERNNTKRLTAQVEFQHRFTENTRLTFKSSYSDFYRKIQVPSYLFNGKQQSLFSELNLVTVTGKTTWITGLNFLSDHFAEKVYTNFPVRDYANNTFGVFLQNTWTPNPVFSIEAGLRGDYTRPYGFELLPRASVLLKVTPQFTMRAGGGLGYKIPSIFNEEAERIQFQQILPVNPQLIQTERSSGINLDFNYKTVIGPVKATVNQLFFYTRLTRSLLLTAMPGNHYGFVNATGPVHTKGMETNLRFAYNDFKLFVGYTYTDASTDFTGSPQWLPLTARHRLNNVLMYEKEENFKIGLEAYYYSPQALSDGTTGRPYWICGIMAEKSWEKFSLFLNFENILDTRQTKFGSIFTGTITNPVFKDIYAPLDGFLVNGGVKLRL